MQSKRSQRIEKVNSISTQELKTGDILLYSVSSDVQPDVNAQKKLDKESAAVRKSIKVSSSISDSTRGVFSHAALFLGFDPIHGNEIMHTGPNGKNSKDISFNTVKNDCVSMSNGGVYVIRFKQTIDEKKLRQTVSQRKNDKYEILKLPFIMLAAWDRHGFDNKLGVYKYISESSAKKAIAFFNFVGSDKVCSGLTLSVLQEVCSKELFSNPANELNKMSPNCIYEEAKKHSNEVMIFELVPMDSKFLDENSSHFLLAGLSTVTSIMGSKLK
ncbi:TPA: hypothetical protein ACGUW3_004457 [Vibrio vulnificus]